MEGNLRKPRNIKENPTENEGKIVWRANKENKENSGKLAQKMEIES